MLDDAYRFIIPLTGAAALLFWLSWIWPGCVLLLLAAFICYFFRNPKRSIPEGKNLVISPADGKVVRIAHIPGESGEADRLLVSIFLNIFNVHANRSPIKGVLQKFEYKRGKFKVAFDEDASRVNEQNILTIRGDDIEVIVKQIAGLIARRVVCWKSLGSKMEQGELIGLIRFGSRVDVILPKQTDILVKTGDLVKGGSSILGKYQNE
jgi:phosphatidylserine decarboxylase